MNVKNGLTLKEAKALRILKEHPCISAKAFACFFYTEPEHQYLFTACSKQGNGACRGKKAWLCAGSYLGRLRKKGYVQLRFINDSFRYDLTSHGEQMLNEYEK